MILRLLVGEVALLGFLKYGILLCSLKLQEKQEP